MTGILDDQIVEALGSVYDPCSLASNAPVSIIDMGLVKSWTVDAAGNLQVTMCVTSACCTMAPNIVRGAVAALTAIPGITAAEVQIDPSVFWTHDSMTERGRETLRRRREQSLARTKTTPQQWRQQVAS